MTEKQLQLLRSQSWYQVSKHEIIFVMEETCGWAVWMEWKLWDPKALC